MRQKPANLRLIADKQATFLQQLGGYAPAGDEMPGEAAVINPVSYTHLDVYKRQTLGFRYMDAGKNSILAAGSEPVAALLLGMLFFREIPSALALVGTVLTIVALALLSRPEKAAAATEYKE